MRLEVFLLWNSLTSCHHSSSSQCSAGFHTRQAFGTKSLFSVSRELFQHTFLYTCVDVTNMYDDVMYMYDDVTHVTVLSEKRALPAHLLVHLRSRVSV